MDKNKTLQAISRLKSGYKSIRPFFNRTYNNYNYTASSL